MKAIKDLEDSTNTCVKFYELDGEIKIDAVSDIASIEETTDGDIINQIEQGRDIDSDYKFNLTDGDISNVKVSRKC